METAPGIFMFPCWKTYVSAWGNVRFLYGKRMFSPCEN